MAGRLRRTFKNTDPALKPELSVSATLNESCGCHFGAHSGANVSARRNGRLEPGHSACDVVALAAAFAAESALMLDDLVACLTQSGMLEAEAREEIERNMQVYLAARKGT